MRNLSNEGYDIIIVSTNTKQQEDFWHKRLKELRGVICKSDAFVIAVSEERSKGAGNGLGTFLALSRAQEKARFMYHTDLLEKQKNGAAVALYHTGGEGKKLFPILASELTDRSAIKLPGQFLNQPITLLEAIIAQTNQCSDKREGRLSVFWGNQIVIPSHAHHPDENHHIEVYTRNDTPLGSFSLSSPITFALLRELEDDLEKEHEHLDATHLWNSLTQGDFEDNRMQAFRKKFFQIHDEQGFFKKVDHGSQSYLWSYKTTQDYYQTVLKLASSCKEGEAMRLFFNIDPKEGFTPSNRIIKDENSCLINCHIQSGKITNSVLIGVEADSIEAENCVIINSKFSSVIAKHSLFYHVTEKQNVKFSKGTIRADVTLPNSQESFSLYGHQERPSDNDWENELPQNPYCYKEVYQKIQKESSLC